MIPYGRQDISDQDIQAVVDILRSDFLTQGPTVPAFERALSNLCDADYAVAFTNATSALHTACLALGVTQGDIVWTSPITFVASANCALYCGASIDFVDIDKKSYNMSVEILAQKLEYARLKGKLPKVVIPVHLAGQSCDMKEIKRLSDVYGFKIIEDASHAVGGKYMGEAIGSCRYSDITIFSFHPVKIITTGDGGMALTNDMGLFGKMDRLRTHGITNKASEMSSHTSEQIWNYEQVDLGYNFRMTDIQAALGLSQLEKLEEFVGRRNSIAEYYSQQLVGLPIVLPSIDIDCYSSYHLYIIRLNLDLANIGHRDAYQEMRRQGILVNLHYIPVYLQPYYQKMGFSRGYCPEAESYFSEAISLPMYPSLTKDQLSKVVSTLTKICLP